MWYFVSVYILFSKSSKIGDSLKWHQYLRLRASTPSIEDPSTVKINFVVSEICNFLSKWHFFTFSSLLFTHMSGNASNPKVNFFVKWSVFSQYIVSKKTNYEKMSIFTKDSLLGSDDQKRSLVVPPPCWLFSWKTRGWGTRRSNLFIRFSLGWKLSNLTIRKEKGGLCNLGRVMPISDG